MTISIKNLFIYLGDNLMKKALLPLIIASLVPASAMADINVYGKVWVSLQSVDLNNYSAGVKGSYNELRNNESRFGIKGSEVLNDNLKMIYQYEFKVEPNDTTTSILSQRNIFVGLTGEKFGTVQAGRFDTPMKLAQEKTDVFKDMQGDWKLIIPGEERGSNTVQYATPAFHFVTGTIAYMTGESAAKADAKGVNDAKGAYKDAYSASIVYNTPALYVALASDHNTKNINGTAPVVLGAGLDTFSSDLYRLVGRYTVGKVVLGAMYESGTGGIGYTNGALDANGKFIDHSGYNLSAIYNVDDHWAVKAQYTASDFLTVAQTPKYFKNTTYKAFDSEMVSVGVDYAFNKKAKLHGYYTTWSDEHPDATKKRDDQYIGVGVELSF
jgi:predicted porin